MSTQSIEYAAGPDSHAIHTRPGIVGFGCAVASACGVVITMVLISHPIAGPLGGITRNAAPVFGSAVLLLWLAGLALGIWGLRERRRLRTFAGYALGTCGATVVLLLLMILLVY